VSIRVPRGHDNRWTTPVDVHVARSSDAGSTPVAKKPIPPDRVAFDFLVEVLGANAFRVRSARSPEGASTGFVSTDKVWASVNELPCESNGETD
jgi:hypothetical protein